MSNYTKSLNESLKGLSVSVLEKDRDNKYLDRVLKAVITARDTVQLTNSVAKSGSRYFVKHPISNEIIEVKVS
jgi:hypothetical protein